MFSSPQYQQLALPSVKERPPLVGILLSLTPRGKHSYTTPRPARPALIAHALCSTKTSLVRRHAVLHTRAHAQKMHGETQGSGTEVVVYLAALSSAWLACMSQLRLVAPQALHWTPGMPELTPIRVYALACPCWQAVRMLLLDLRDKAQVCCTAGRRVLQLQHERARALELPLKTSRAEGEVGQLLSAAQAALALGARVSDDPCVGPWDARHLRADPPQPQSGRLELLPGGGCPAGSAQQQGADIKALERGPGQRMLPPAVSVQQQQQQPAAAPAPIVVPPPIDAEQLERAATVWLSVWLLQAHVHEEHRDEVLAGLSEALAACEA